jgi:hypothetical protein
MSLGVVWGVTVVGLRYAVAKPRMCQLVHDDVDQSAIAGQERRSEEGETGVFLSVFR